MSNVETITSDKEVPSGATLPDNKLSPKCGSCGRLWEAYLDGVKMDRVVWATHGKNGAMVTLDITRTEISPVSFTLHTGHVELKRVP